MFRNYLAAALNNLARNRLYAVISILGLAVGMAAAILTSLYIRDELTFDRFIPGHDKLYVVVTETPIPGRATPSISYSPAPTGALLRAEFPAVEATARLLTSPTDPSLRHGQVEALDPIAWVDPNFFSMVRLPVVAGDPAATIARPDGMVLTRSMARKYFGRDAPIGELLEVNRTSTFRVGAVVEDLPATTNIVQRIFASGLSSVSAQHMYDAMPLIRGQIVNAGRTYVRLKSPAAAAAIDQAMPAFALRHFAGPGGWVTKTPMIALRLVRLDDLHMTPLAGIGTIDIGQGNPQTLVALAVIAALILLIAGINFVNLMTARAGRRMVEVGVRKAAGAERRHLVVQFVGEAVVHSLIALILAAVMVELALPFVRGVMDRPMVFAYWRDPGLIAAALVMGLGLGVLAGVYPALVQSSFRPVQVLKGGAPATAGSLLLREGLVVAQFAILIALIFSIVVVTRQTRFAMNEGLRVDKDQTMIMDISPVSWPGHPAPPAPRCRDAFVDAVRALPGVRDAACSSPTGLDIYFSMMVLTIPNGETVTFNYADVDYGFLEFYGLKPLAGRFFSKAFRGDEAPVQKTFGFPPRVVVNEAAVRAMHMGSPGQAVGQTLRPAPGAKAAPVLIVGVVPDFGFNLLHPVLQPRAYGVNPQRLTELSIRLAGRDLPETVKAIDDAWRRLGAQRAPSHRFVDDYLQTIYLNVLRQGYLIDALCGVAVFIATLGLFGLAAFTAERRTKEIGIRKAMGASKADIVRLLLWQFTRPVLWANLIAWPLGWWAMDRWLHGFSARIALGPGLFLAASAAALLIAWATVLAQALKVAAAKPVGALRYE